MYAAAVGGGLGKAFIRNKDCSERILPIKSAITEGIKTKGRIELILINRIVQGELNAILRRELHQFAFGFWKIFFPIQFHRRDVEFNRIGTFKVTDVIS